MFIFEVSAKFYSLFMTLVLAFNSFTFTLPVIPKLADVDIDYVFDNDKSYSAAGTVTVSTKFDGKYELYWGDENHNLLKEKVKGYTATYSEFATVKTDDGEGSADIYSFTAIPEDAESVLAYFAKTQVASFDLPENKKQEEETPIYRFGSLSDLHFNRYYLSLTDDSMCAFPNALNFLDAYDVSLVALSGDLSNNSETNAFEKFNYIASKYDFPVYTCTGNHDVKDTLDKDAWRRLVNTGVYGENKADGVLDVNEETFDFVYAPNKGNDDVFIFLSQYAWSYNNESSRILSDEQLDWLEAQLKKYSDRTVYVYFHTFLADDENNTDSGEGNIINNKGVTYDLVYTVGTPDEIRFRSLLKEYKNVICFNGHSHWAFDQVKYNPIMNITDYDGTYATLVHNSSVSSPRRVRENASERTEYNMRSSEGYLVSVYEDRIVLQGIDFLRGEFLSYANYVIVK